MRAPKGIKKAFDYWGQGLVHYLIGDADLKKRNLGEASAMLAYT